MRFCIRKGAVMKSVIAAVVAGVGMLALPAAAQDAPPAFKAAPVAPAPVAPQDQVGRDVHCFMIFMGLSAGSEGGENAMQTGARMMAFYWYGKLSGQITDAELEKRLIAEGPNLKGDVVKADFMRCGGEAGARSDAMQTILEHVGAAEAAAAPKDKLDAAPDAPQPDVTKPDAPRPDAMKPDAPKPDAPKPADTAGEQPKP
jgi:hypothetical protein